MYEYLILIADDSDFNMAVLVGYLKEFYAANEDRTVNIEGGEDQIIVLVERFPFYLGLSDEPHVQEEAAEIAEAWTGDPAAKERMKQSGRRIEMRADGQDFNMDYFNDSLYILGEIEKFDGIYIFDPANGGFV